MKNLYFYDTILGVLGISDNGKEITEVYFGDENSQDLDIEETPLIKEIGRAHV